jgi:hypothetical protein
MLIYKNSGVWYDYGQGIGPLPYRKLVSLTLKSNDEAAIEQFLVEAQEFVAPPRNEYIEMSKIYPLSTLDDLLPSYKFYLDRQIPEETLKLYKCGFSGAGKLYRRIVFPIFNEFGLIHGWSGRKIDENNDSPKWLHQGKRREWVYPYYVDNTFVDNMGCNEEIILVESIGDSLALTTQGIHNHLVLFGLSPSSAVLKTLMALAPSQITLALNNDLDSGINRGQLGALKAMISLSKFFDISKIKIKPPLCNDFGDMHEAGMDLHEWLEVPDTTRTMVAMGVKLMGDRRVVFSGPQRKALIKLNNG